MNLPHVFATICISLAFKTQIASPILSSFSLCHLPPLSLWFLTLLLHLMARNTLFLLIFPSFLTTASPAISIFICLTPIHPLGPNLMTSSRKSFLTINITSITTTMGWGLHMCSHIICCYLLINTDHSVLKISVYLSLVLCFREGNGTSLQYSCLENPMDRRVW